MASKTNEFKSFFDGNSSYFCPIDFTVSTGGGTKQATLTGLSFTLTEESVISGFGWNVTENEMIPVEDVSVTTGPDVITFNDLHEDFTGSEKIVIVLKGPNRLGSGGSSLSSSIVNGEDVGTSTDAGQVVIGFDGSNFRLLKVNTDGELVNSAYSVSSDANRGEEIDPLSEKYESETVIDFTNMSTNTTDYGYIDMHGYRYIILQGITDGTSPTDVLTVTIEGTVQDDGTALASCDWDDITSELSGSASFVDEDFHVTVDTPIAYRAIRIKYVTSNASGNDCDLTVYSKKMW